jgi:hypothetical protein
VISGYRLGVNDMLFSLLRCYAALIGSNRSTLYSYTNCWRRTRPLNYWSLLTIISHVYCTLPTVTFFISLEIFFQSSFHFPNTYIVSHAYAFFQVRLSMHWNKYKFSRLNNIIISNMFPAYRQRTKIRCLEYRV